MLSLDENNTLKIIFYDVEKIIILSILRIIIKAYLR